MPNAGNAERGHQLDQRDGTRDQRERRPDPGQEGAFVGQRESVVRFLLGTVGHRFSIGPGSAIWS